MLKQHGVQFALLGALYFVSSRLFPEPKPVLGPPNAERLAAMAGGLICGLREVVNAELLARFVDGELRDELLFREALHRGLQYRDAAVEQRIMRNMRFLDSREASDAELMEQGYALRCTHRRSYSAALGADCGASHRGDDAQRHTQWIKFKRDTSKRKGTGASRRVSL